MLKISLIGCGFIGTEIAKATSSIKDVELVAVVDLDRKKAEKVVKLSKDNPKITNIDEAVSLADLVVECAVKDVVYEIATKSLKSGKDIMIMSTGGLVEHLELLDLARKKDVCIYLPSGAVSGLDGIKSATAGKVYSVSLTTSKPPISLKGAPYLIDNKINLDDIKEKKVIFEGKAIEAIKGFPANINVAVCLSLAGIGLEKTKVKIVADPSLKVNVHKVEIIGDFGKITTITENVQAPTNPKTSYLAALSAVATFKRIIDPVKIGT
ncbi:MAG: aspartate dehydrogenase [Candidatus Firestonebacteria bacterium]